MANAVITLEMVARYVTMLDVGCRKCDRSGRYRVTGLIEKYGASAALPDLRRIIAADCPKMGRNIDVYDRCEVNFPGLPTVL